VSSDDKGNLILASDYEYRVGSEGGGYTYTMIINSVTWKCPDTKRMMETMVMEFLSINLIMRYWRTPLARRSRAAVTAGQRMNTADHCSLWRRF
jgi:hypothetical protein